MLGGQMVAREVIASFAVFVDDRPLTALDKKINVMSRNIRDVAFVASAAFSGVTYGLYKVATAASSVVENMNVLGVIFGESRNNILEWSKSASQAMGRSQYEFQRYAGDFGSILKAQFAGSDINIAEMSKALAERSVDLASFRNVSDETAITNMISGMSGETEAVRKYGIDISDEAMEKWNKAHGGFQTMRAMDQTEKKLIRFEMIMEQTAHAMGDAERTAGTFANQMRKLTGAWEEFKIVFGTAIDPFTVGTVRMLNKALSGAAEAVKYLSEQTSSLYAVLGFVGAFWASSLFMKALSFLASPRTIALLFDFFGGMKGGLMTALPYAAALAAELLFLEDVLTMNRGGKSVVGDLIKEMADVRDPVEWLIDKSEELAVRWEALGNYAKNFGAILSGLGDYLFLDKTDTLFKTMSREEIVKPVTDFFARKEQRRANKEETYRRAVASGDSVLAINSLSGEHADLSERKKDMTTFVADRRKYIESQRTVVTDSSGVTRRILNPSTQLVEGDVRAGAVTGEEYQAYRSAQAAAQEQRAQAAAKELAARVGIEARGGGGARGPTTLNVQISNDNKWTFNGVEMSEEQLKAAIKEARPSMSEDEIRAAMTSLLERAAGEP